MKNENLKITTINEKTAVTYNEDYTNVKHVFCKSRNMQDIKFNNNTVKICEAAGREIWAPINLIFPFELRTVEIDAFSGSTGIKDVCFNDKLLKIGEYAFSGTCIKTLDIPLNVEEIGKEAFSECRDLESVLSFGNVKALYEGVFANCVNLKNVNIPESVDFIDDFAFFNCKNLVEITLPKNLTYISKSAFMECDNLKTITMSQKTYDKNPEFVEKYKNIIKVKSKVTQKVFNMEIKNVREHENMI